MIFGKRAGSTVYYLFCYSNVDNIYKFGHCEDGTNTAPAFINTFQRGSQESVWETVTQPSCDLLKFGGKNGYLDLFTGDSSYAKQWKYTNAPDADARVVQVALLAQQWATAQGKAGDISAEIGKSAKMGDYLRYAMFDKYFKRIGNCFGVLRQTAEYVGKKSIDVVFVNLGWRKHRLFPLTPRL